MEVEQVAGIALKIQLQSPLLLILHFLSPLFLLPQVFAFDFDDDEENGERAKCGDSGSLVVLLKVVGLQVRYDSFINNGLCIYD